MDAIVDGQNGRTEALGVLLAELADRAHGSALDEGWCDAVSMLLVDAIVERDGETLAFALSGLSHAAAKPQSPQGAGCLRALVDVARWGEERGGHASAVPLEPGSYMAQFIDAVAAWPGASNELLSDALGVDTSEISRVGKRVRLAGLAVSRKLGRKNSWELTPRGLSLVEQHPVQRFEITGAWTPDAEQASVDPESLAVEIRDTAATLAQMIQRLRAAEQSQRSSPIRSDRDDAFEVLVRPLSGMMTDSVRQIRAVVDAGPGSPSAPPAVADDEFLVALSGSAQRSVEKQRAVKAVRVRKSTRGRWAVTVGGGRRPLKTFAKKSDAVRFGRAIAADRDADLDVQAAQSVRS